MDVDQDGVNLSSCISHCEADDFSFCLVVDTTSSRL